MGFVRNLLSETSGLSTTRFVQVVGLAMAFVISLVGLKLHVDLIGLSILCMSFIIPQTIAKVMQKKVEQTK